MFDPELARKAQIAYDNKAIALGLHYVCLLGSVVCSSKILKTPLYISYILDMQ